MGHQLFLRECCHLFEEFALLFREREGSAEPNGDDRTRAALRWWMEEARESEILEIEAFAAKLFQDKDAGVAATVRQWRWCLRAAVSVNPHRRQDRF